MSIGNLQSASILRRFTTASVICGTVLLSGLRAQAAEHFDYRLKKSENFALSGEVLLKPGESIGLDTFLEETDYSGTEGTFYWDYQYCVSYSMDQADMSAVKAEELNDAYVSGRTSPDTYWKIPTMTDFYCDVGYKSTGKRFDKEFKWAGIVNSGSVPVYVSHATTDDEYYTWTEYSDYELTVPRARTTRRTIILKLRFVSQETSASDNTGSTADNTSGSTSGSTTGTGSGNSSGSTAGTGTGTTSGTTTGTSTGSSKSTTTTGTTTKQSTPILKKGSSFTVSISGYKHRYKMTGSKSLQLTGISGKTTSVTIPDRIYYNGTIYKVTSVAAKAFAKNKKIKTVVIGKYVTTLGDNAFSGCTALTKVTIGAGVKKIGKNCFKGDKKLKTITIKSKKLKKSAIGSKAFSGIYSKAVIKVPSGYAKKYKPILKAKGIGSKVKVK